MWGKHSGPAGSEGDVPNEKLPLLPNGRFDSFPPKTLPLRDGLHLVEKLADGRFLAIRKPGRLSAQDFVVQLLDADQATVIETVSHVDLLQEFHRALAKERSAGLRFGSVAFRVFGGKEPIRLPAVAGPGRPVDYILKALKWIWAQEDVNHPIVQGRQGRKMAGYRLQEVLDGVPLRDVARRAEAKGYRPGPLPGVDYARVDRALRGREP